LVTDLDRQIAELDGGAAPEAPLVPRVNQLAT
jgi:hypothetical protein